MKAVRFLETVEHRFVHERDEAVTPHNDIAALGARQVAQAEVPDLDMLATVWKVPEGAEMSVPDKDADRLVKLGYAEVLPADAPSAEAPAA